MIKKITGIMLIPSIIVFISCFFLKETIINLLFGKEFIAAAHPFMILLICALQGSIFFWALPLIQSMGLIKKRFLVYLSAIIIGGFTSLLLIPSLNESGAAMGLLAANLFITFRFLQAGYHELNQTSLSTTK